ncbi:MAG: 1-acyl-sn-glycerol-3-phosphate acyltransferase [Actinomycetota bacterium]|nr:1-acyl-sn-glycerol-3-phosphate acyltransferase [Actinomycetota bacterium]
MALPPRWLRRVLSPVFLAVEVVLLVVCAILGIVGLVVAPVDRRLRLVRIGAFGVAYFAMESLALVASLVAWLTRWAHPAAWWEDYHYRLLRWVLAAILGAARRCCGFVIAIDEPARAGPLGDEEPVLVLARHGGLGDSFTLVWLLLDRYHRRVRIVLKDVLQWEPLLDVILNRLDACFLPGGGAAAGDHLAGRLAAVAGGLGRRDALLVFPEGGNWTPGRWQQAIRRLRKDRKYQAASAAALMSHVLPPRPAGVLACVDARPDLAVVIIAHTGLDKLTTAGGTWKAIPFTEPMTVRWWPPSPVPDGDAARLQWLTTEWAVIDEWIDAHHPGSAGPVDQPV